jgi:alpha-tubulin suppressor-like RCC1 family protein
VADQSWRHGRPSPAARRSALLRGAAALIALVALLPAAPAAAADIPWPDNLDPDTVRAATVGATSIAAGGAHSCALSSLGEVYCWGENSSGQLGDDNSPVDSAGAVSASVTGDLVGVAVQVDAGAAHTCALDYDGSVYCWGDNSAGQLGVGPSADMSVPVQVPTLAGRTVVEIATGAEHSCAVDEDGAAWCWGDNSAGQLGAPGSPTGSDLPVRVSTLTGMTDPVVDIDAGAYTTCATTAPGDAYCWGADTTGQLGDDPASADRPEPAAVATTGPLGGKVRQVAVGGVHACALDDDGAASCWGDNTVGALGEGPGLDAPRPEPVAVDDAGALAGARLAEITAGGEHTCGLSTAGAAYCWGSDGDGQLGDGGATTDRDVPVMVDRGARPVTAELSDLAAGDRHTCALDDDGSAYCWGADTSGQLGNGAAGASGVPVRVQGLPVPPEAVSHLRLTALDGGLRATWREPADFGSGDFVLYLAITAGFESGCVVQTVHDTGCNLTGLTNGEEYDVAVLVLATGGTALSDFITAKPRAASSSGGGGGQLPITGPALPLYLGAAGTLLVAGAAALLLARRRTRWVS